MITYILPQGDNNHKNSHRVSTQEQKLRKQKQ